MAQEPLDNAFAQQPTNLASPVPTEAGAQQAQETIDETAQQINSLFGGGGAAPEEPSQIQAAVGGAVDAVDNTAAQIQQLFAQGGQAVDPATLSADETPTIPLPDRGFLAKHFVPINFKERLLSGLGESPKQSVALLEKYLGKGNAKLRSDGHIIFKPKGKKDFIKLEPGAVELIGDLFVDNARDVINDVAGGAAVLAQGPGALEPLSSAAAFGLGVAGSEIIIDTIIEDLYGIAPEGNRLLKAGGKGVIAGAFHGVGTKVSKALTARSAAKKTLKSIKDVPEYQIFQKQLDADLDMFKQLEEMNLTTNLPGGDLPVSVRQLAPYSPNVQKTVSEVTNTALLAKAEASAIGSWDDTMKQLIANQGDLSRQNIDNLVESGVRTRGRAGIPLQVKNLLKATRTAEGKVIEKYRIKAGERAGNQPINMDNTLGVLEEIKKTFGDTFPDDTAMAQILGTDSPFAINGFKRDVKNLAQQLVPGADGRPGMTLDKMTQTLDNLSPKIETALKSSSKFGDKYKVLMSKMGSALRSDRRNGMRTILDPEDAKLYDDAIAGFIGTADAQRDLALLLKESNVASNTFAKSLISQGRKGLAQFSAAKQFLSKEDPELWKKVSSEIVENIILENRITDPVTSFNSGGVRRAFAKLGPEFLDELLPNGDHKLLFRALDMGDKLAGRINSKSDDAVAESLKAMAQTVSPFHQGQLNGIAHWLHLYDNNGRVIKLLNKKGLDELLEVVPKAQQGQWRSTIAFHLNAAKERGIIPEVNPRIMEGLKSGAEAVGRTTRDLPGVLAGEKGAQGMDFLRTLMSSQQGEQQ